VRLISLIGAGDTIVAEIESNLGTRSGVCYANQYRMPFHFRDGKIVEIVEYCDTDLEESARDRYGDALTEYVASNG
jgi:uncharacterized protein